MKAFLFFVACLAIAISDAYKDYTGHKVITVIPKFESDIELLHKLKKDYSVDLWNDPRAPGTPVMVHLRPELIEPIEKLLDEKDFEYDVAFYNLQSAIEAERESNAPTNVSNADGFDFGKYNTYEPIIQLLKDLSNKYPSIASLDTVGKSYENRPIYSMKISAGESIKKPAIMMECGIHAREWSSVAAGVYIVNRLITTYDSDPEVKKLVDKYEFNIVVEANPDGYVYTFTQDRLWRKTRSRSSIDWLGVCRGVDANRNFDIEHCGLGTSRKPCEEDYCGEKPFSESESRALRDMIIDKKDRLSAYFSLHAYSQFWMTPYGISKKLPENYDELIRIGKIGVEALAKKYGTQFTIGSIANIIYEAAGSSVDYAYETHGVKIAYALELRDYGRHGFILPKKDIIPMCEETYDGIKAVLDVL